MLVDVAQPMAAQSRYRCVKTLRRRMHDVKIVAILPNGRVVSGSRDRTLKVWNASTSQCIRTLTGHTDDARRRRPVEPRD